MCTHRKPHTYYFFWFSHACSNSMFTQHVFNSLSMSIGLYFMQPWSCSWLILTWWDVWCAIAIDLLFSAPLVDVTLQKLQFFVFHINAWAQMYWPRVCYESCRELTTSTWWMMTCCWSRQAGQTGSYMLCKTAPLHQTLELQVPNCFNCVHLCLFWACYVEVYFVCLH